MDKMLASVLEEHEAEQAPSTLIEERSPFETLFALNGRRGFDILTQ